MDRRKCFYFFNGYYAVAAASDALSRYHITNRIVKAPVTIKNSCSFAVMIKSADSEMASYVLERESIAVKRMEHMENQLSI